VVGIVVGVEDQSVIENRLRFGNATAHVAIPQLESRLSILPSSSRSDREAGSRGDAKWGDGNAPRNRHE
jgi:hypothetical protein